MSAELMDGIENVTANVFTHTGLRGSNPSFVVTSDGVVAIDTPQLPSRAVEWRREAESHGPIRYLINTEHHVDHIFGNYYFRGSGATVVNHRELLRPIHGPRAGDRPVRLRPRGTPRRRPRR